MGKCGYSGSGGVHMGLVRRLIDAFGMNPVENGSLLAIERIRPVSILIWAEIRDVPVVLDLGIGEDYGADDDPADHR
jgi:hypothetical protein